VTGSIVVAKGHGTGNDFVLLVDPAGEVTITPERVRVLCDRRFGIGGDGLLRVVRTERLTAADDPGGPWGSNAPEWFMDYRNADGSVSEMCGNGIRVFARYLRAKGWIAPGRTRIATRGGEMTVEVPSGDGDISVLMGQPDNAPYPAQVSVQVGEEHLTATAMNLPNPHAVTFVAALDALPEHLPVPGLPESVFPNGANVEFVEVLEADGSAARMRVYERGVGETLSCGTGACAAAVAVIAATGGRSDSVAMTVPGGQLMITVAADGAVTLAGPAVIVAEGDLDTSWWELQAP
jgi:diaminopimelate epimerase